jgi:hypothetical protein
MHPKSQSDGKSLIYLMIGRCIAEWASIEETLFDIFCMALGTHTELCSIVFYKTPTLDSRVALTTELLEARFPKSSGKHDHILMKEWRAIRAELLDLIVIRNLMAHHPIDEVETGTYRVAHLQSESTKLPPVKTFKQFKIETNKSEQLRKRSIRSLIDSDMPEYLTNVQHLHARIQEYRLSLQKLLLSPPYEPSETYLLGQDREDSDHRQTQR